MMTLDQRTNALMTSIENPTLTIFSKIVDIITEPNYLLLLLLATAVYLYYVKKNSKKAWLLALSTLATGIIVKILKVVIARPRPLNTLIETTSASFPSGHATVITFFLGILIYLFSKKSSRKKSLLIAIPIILTVAFTRIYLRVHYLTDVLGGIILGSLILMLLIYLDKNQNLFRHLP